jgi:hypothetical protein
VLRTSETGLFIVFLPMLRCYAPPKRVYSLFFYKCYGATHLRNGFIHCFATNVTVLRTSETGLFLVLLPMLRCYAPQKRVYSLFCYQCYGATHLRNGFIHCFATNVTVLRTFLMLWVMDRVATSPTLIGYQYIDYQLFTF